MINMVKSNTIYFCAFIPIIRYKKTKMYDLFGLPKKINNF